ncbi:ABC-type cobalt transport system, permease component CbiQ [Marinitoga piezophila KA3]|uniref:ABC-type cobalt transport system, permease component CbiQ n=1 Tax=Marinitoga piezophila (strain DSM 14283 / JCM 11233 / KA3) TaxID=443254 RepID=H2J840_MARPK|nr:MULTISPECIES: energy-coupling factor transporter transmembrane component T [Marinitoga]AEX85531.1 ABC-type cobalt transport system, permease component CbiQ [Marinitoga piezophila KA3]NUU97669.1 cobalt transporter [Marinitoga sp. 1138]
MFSENIAIGRYVEKESLMHSLDPRSKLIGLFFLAGFAFTINSFYDVAIMSFYTFLLMLLSRIGLKMYGKSLKSMWMLIVFAFVIQLFNYEGNVIYQLWFIKITDVGLSNAAIITFRLFFAIMLSSVLTLTTSPTSLANAMEDVLIWFRVKKSFAHELSMVMTIAIRFIPVMASEAERIFKAQMSRGADFDSRKFSGRLKGMVAIIIPLLVSALRRADELSIAMESRCYNGWEGRTRYKQFNWKFKDTLFTLSYITVGILVIIL